MKNKLMNHSIAATELAKLGKCELLIAPNFIEKPKTKDDLKDILRGNNEHKEFESAAKKIFSSTKKNSTQEKTHTDLILFLILSALIFYWIFLS